MDQDFTNTDIMKACKSLSSNSQADCGQILCKVMVFLIFSILVSAQYSTENLTTTITESNQTEQPCFTQPCLFPFMHKGRTFNECTLFDSDDEWCAIKVYGDGTVKDWHYCSRAKQPCQIPFYYKGITFTECTRYQQSWYGDNVVGDNEDFEWCATEVYGNRTMKQGKWAWCEKNCSKGQGITFDRIICISTLS